MCIELINSEEDTVQFLGALIIHQNIKERAKALLDNKTEFFKFRTLIFDNLLDKIRSSSSQVIQRICYSIAILIGIGVITYWPEAIEDALAFARISKENCYISTIILEDIYKEVEEMNISKDAIRRIKNNLSDKKELIQDFVLLVLRTVKSSEDGTLNKAIFNNALKMTQSWVKSGLNLLKIPLLSQLLIEYIDSDNIDLISNIFCDSIAYSSNSKFASVHEIYNIDEIMDKMDKDEILSLYNLLTFLKQAIANLREDIDSLNGLANIFTSITENHVYLFFTVIYYFLLRLIRGLF